MRRLAYISAALYASLWCVAVLEIPIYHLAYSDALERILVRVGVDW